MIELPQNLIILWKGVRIVTINSSGKKYHQGGMRIIVKVVIWRPTTMSVRIVGREWKTQILGVVESVIKNTTNKKQTKPEDTLIVFI